MPWRGGQVFHAALYSQSVVGVENSLNYAIEQRETNTARAKVAANYAQVQAGDDVTM